MFWLGIVSVVSIVGSICGVAWFVTRRGVLNGLNWARAKLGKGPMEGPTQHRG